MTFELEDITEELAQKVIFVQYIHSSGLGGVGSITAVTEEGQEYYFGLHECESSEKELEILKRFLGENANDKERYADPENHKGFKDLGSWLCKGQVLVRKDFFDRYFDAFQKRDMKISPEAVRAMLDPQNKLPRKIYRRTAEIWKEEERRRKEYEERQVKNRLTEGEDYEWKEFEYGFEKGYYLLLFKEDNDGSISGSKWTIICQIEQFEEGGQYSNAPIEAYNLYYERYENMGGILKYPEKGEDKEIYKYTTLTDGVNSYGEFRRTYFTLEQAKYAALKRNEFIGWGNYCKDNLLRTNWDEMTLEEAKKDYFRAVKRQKELRLLFPEICGEVLQILSKYDFPVNAVDEISEKLSLSKKDVRSIYRYFSDSGMFCKYGIEETKKMLAEAEGTAL